MIEYAKVILPKVCNWEQLFRKELIKCINWTEPDELPELYKWCYTNFNTLYPEILEAVFAQIVHEQNTEGILIKMESDYLAAYEQLQKTG